MRPPLSRNVTSKCKLLPDAPCHVKGDGSWWAKDARGIELRRVCEHCEHLLKRDYRANVLDDASYEAEEPIDED